MNLRDWLILIGVVIIIGIVLDGFRRMRLAKKDSLQMSRDMGGDLEITPIDDGYNPELPGGGARIVGNVDGDISDSDQLQADVDAPDFENPVLTNPVLKHREEPHLGDPLLEPSKEDELSETLVADSHSRIEVKSVDVKTVHAGKKSKSSTAELESSKENDQTLCIVINVHAATNHGFPGTEVKKLLEACGLDHGDMSIFHRHEEDDLLSPIQFSVANAIEPGYFDPSTLDEISTPGVSFFMTLPGPKDYSKAFEYMLETAQCFARNLKGDLKDEQLSVITAQTIEHNRQKIKDFERRQLSKMRTRT